MRTPLSDIVWIFSSISWRFPCSSEHYKFGFLLHAGDSFFKQKVEMQKRYSLLVSIISFQSFHSFLFLLAEFQLKRFKHELRNILL